MDKIDLKILDLLARNCRLYNTTIARAVNLSKDSVRHRIANLEDQGVITHYNTILDLRPLDISKFHLLLKTSGGIQDSDLAKKLERNGSVSFANTCIGKYDVHLIVDTHDVHSMDRATSDILESVGGVEDYTVLNFVHDLKHTNLFPDINLGTDYDSKLDASFSSITTKFFEAGREYEQAEIDDLDMKILESLCDDPRRSLVDLARNIDCSRETAKNRVVNLLEDGVVKNFGANISFEEFGYVTYLLLLKTNSPLDPERVRKGMRRMDNIFYAAKVQGSYTVLLYPLAKSPGELKGCTRQLEGLLGERVREMEVLLMDRILLYRQLPTKVVEELGFP